MKLTAVLITVACLQVSAHSDAQQKITFSGKDIPLEKVLSIIKKQTGYLFFYNKETIQNTKVTLDVKEASLEEVMVLCLKEHGLDYTVEGKTIFIVKKQESEKKEEPGISFPPNDIKGRITNLQGEPLAGANVVIKQTGRGTQTDANGIFTLKSVNADDILVISYTGYQSIAIKTAGQTNLTLILELASNELDKVIIQAYGTTTQRLNTGNIATVTATEIERQPVINPLQALQGRVPGLVVTQINGYASAPFRVQIRGKSVIRDVPSDPLYIIDGVPLTVLEVGGVSSYQNGSTGFIQNPSLNGPAGGQSPLFSINPSDVESITVLKDADATAIYGSRGANGVIIINTKKGNAGKTKVDINVYHGINKVTRYFNLLNTQQYVAMRQEAFRNDGITPDVGSAYDLLVWDTTSYTDWQKYLWGGVGRTTDAELSLTGGDKQTTFRIAAGYRKFTDITTVSGSNQRGSIQFNLSHKSLNQRFNVSFTNFYSFAKVNMISVSALVKLPPNAPAAFDSKGNLNYSGWAPISYSFPFYPLLQPYDSKTNFLNSQLSLKYEIISGLTITTRFGYSNATVTQHKIFPIASQDPAINPKGAVQFGYNNPKNWIIEPQADYYKFIGKGKLSILFGASTQSASFDGNFIQGDGYNNDNFLNSISNAPIKTANDLYGRFLYAAIFGRLNYEWRKKYILNISGRRDGSSRFGSGNQFGNFGAVGAAWIFTEEKWVKKNFSWLSFGKVRGSYGTVGNDQIGDYQYLTRWSSSGQAPYQGIPSYVPLQHANPNYHWEVNRKLEFGLQMNFLRDRLNCEIAWYRNRCDNQLIGFPLPNLTGFSGVTANSLANLQNTGLEVILNAKISDNKDIKWNAAFNIALNHNKLIDYPNLLQSPYANYYFIGESIHMSRLLHYTGVDPLTGKYTYEDKNEDGNINASFGSNDDLYNYNREPKFTGGFGSDFNYKNWQLNLFFSFAKQIGLNAFINSDVPGTISNQPVQILNRWTKPGDISTYAHFTTQPVATDYYYYQNSNAILTDASFIRLTNLSLSYNLSDPWIKKLGLSSCRIYFQGENLFLITKYDGIDPETQAFSQMPPAKIFTGGIRFNF